MDWLKRILFIFFLLFALLAGTAVFISWKFGEQLEGHALETLRSRIETDVVFKEDVTVSLWRDFPLIAVEIHDVYIQDAFRTDTLLAVEKAFVQFDILKILRNNFTIAGIRVSDGLLRLKRTETDAWNFRVWKKDTTRANKQKTDFSIEILTLENIHLDYDDRMVDLNIRFRSDRSKIKGRFTDENQRLGLSLDGFMHRLKMVGSDRVVSLPLSLAGVLNIRSKEKTYTVEMGNALLAGNEMVWDAEWKRTEQDMHMQLQIHAGGIDPHELLPHLWPQMPTNIHDLEMKGNSDLVLRMEGPFTRTHGPELDASLKMTDGELLFRDTRVSDLNFNSRIFIKDIKRSKALRVSFGSFSLRTPTGKVKGSGVLTDLNNPHLKISSTGTSRLEEIITVTDIADQMKGSGNVTWNIDFSGPLGRDFNTTLNDLRNMEWTGSIDLSGAEMTFDPGIPPITGLTAAIAMEADRTEVQNCSGSIGHITFDGSIRMPDIKSMIIEQSEPIALSGQVHIRELDISRLPIEWQFSTDPGNAPTRTVSMNGRTHVDNIRYRGFSATDLSGELRMHRDRLTVNGLRFNALDGTARADLAYHPIEKGYRLAIDADLSNIDMKQTLAEWDDFGQKTITSDNLKGRATASISAVILMGPGHGLLKDELNVETDLEISGGELIDLEPLLAMSKFISVDELQHVKFDTLRNRISIKDSRISIPKMTVSSSILNVNVFGEHGFDQEMDYHVNLLLNDLLRRKAKRKKTFEGHEVVDHRGKTRLFLRITGKPHDLKVGFDKREVRRKIKDDFRKEGQTIKQLFREEFGGGEPAKGEEETVQFRLEDEETEPNEEAETKDGTEKPEKKKKKRGFLDTDPETDETEGAFEIEFDP